MLVVALVIVGWVGGRWLLRRSPTVSYTQIYCASMACLGGVLTAAGRSSAPFWYYTGLLIAVVTGTFLILVFLRRLDRPRPTGSA
jgi:hypothetical protein